DQQEIEGRPRKDFGGVNRGYRAAQSELGLAPNQFFERCCQSRLHSAASRERYKLPEGTVTVARATSNATPGGSLPSATALIWARSIRRIMTMPRSLVARCSSE